MLSTGSGRGACRLRARAVETLERRGLRAAVVSPTRACRYVSVLLLLVGRGCFWIAAGRPAEACRNSSSAHTHTGTHTHTVAHAPTRTHTLTNISTASHTRSNAGRPWAGSARARERENGWPLARDAGRVVWCAFGGTAVGVSSDWGSLACGRARAASPNPEVWACPARPRQAHQSCHSLQKPRLLPHTHTHSLSLPAAAGVLLRLPPTCHTAPCCLLALSQCLLFVAPSVLPLTLPSHPLPPVHRSSTPHASARVDATRP
jgi:hypothetical protein